MPEITPPDDLIDLKTRWYAAREHAEQIAAEAPEGDDEITVKPRHAGEQERTIRLFSDEQSRRLAAARAEVQRLTLELFRHPWKARQEDRHAAQEAVDRLALVRHRARG